MRPGQFPRRRGNWESLVKLQSPVKKVVPDLQVFGELPDDLLPELGAVLVMKAVLVDELPGPPVSLDPGLLNTLLAEQKRLADTL